MQILGVDAMEAAKVLGTLLGAAGFGGGAAYVGTRRGWKRSLTDLFRPIIASEVKRSFSGLMEKVDDRVLEAVRTETESLRRTVDRLEAIHPPEHP